MTHHETALLRLIRAKTWLHSHDFTGEKYNTLLSHKGPARVAELADNYPQMVERDKSERVHKYRFRFDNSLEFLPLLPVKLAKFVKKALQAEGMRYNIYKQVPIFNDALQRKVITK
jgi:hypothetical protein